MKRIKFGTYAIKMKSGKWAIVEKSKLRHGRYDSEAEAVKAYGRGDY